ncbi:MAG: hypothetical protein QNK37_27365 [Acidobacteriota bacterium]|nr:hypothetical protein [Acidobacteriota bacterium]
MNRYDQKKMEKHPAGFYLGVDALTDTDLLQAAQHYKRARASRYRLLKPDDLGQLGVEEVFASVKQDGQLHFLYKNGDCCFLFNPKGRVISGLPLLEEAKQVLRDHDGALLAGELYCPNQSGRSRVYDVTAALGRDGADQASKLKFGVFDILQLGGERYIRPSYASLIARLDEHLPADGAFHRIPFKKLPSAELPALFGEQVQDGGHEGLVCYSDATHRVYKIKPKHHVDAVIIGYTQRPEDTGAVRVLLTALMRPDGSFQTFAKVGTGFDEMQRRELFRMLAPLKVGSNYHDTDRGRGLFTMVRPRHVIEVAFHDVLTESNSGKPQMKPVLRLEERGWRAAAPERFVSVLFPVFAGLRPDKAVNPTDLRLTQVAEFVDLDNLEAPSKAVVYAPGEVQKLEVFVKQTKGLTAVRKLVYWKTNKDQVDADYPPYVFCYVDYSPNRAQPLRRTVRGAPDREAAEAFFARFKASEIKRGYQLQV